LGWSTRCGCGAAGDPAPVAAEFSAEGRCSIIDG
jgi:hypothetical protein